MPWACKKALTHALHKPATQPESAKRDRTQAYPPNTSASVLHVARPACVQAAFDIWWVGSGTAAGAYGQVPTAGLAWNGSAYAGSVALPTAGAATLYVQHDNADLANSPLSLTVLPGPLAANQVLPLGSLAACCSAPHALAAPSSLGAAPGHHRQLHHAWASSWCPLYVWPRSYALAHCLTVGRQLMIAILAGILAATLT